MITANTRIACVIGRPVRHSLSPAIHNAAFAASSVDAVYLALDVEESALAVTVEALRGIGFLGASVTMPYKQAALSICDEVGESAGLLGSLNTLIPLDNGRMRGESTDGAGCVGALRAAGRDPRGAHCIVVGAGATARACVVGLAQAGATSIGVVNRTRERAASTAGLAPFVARVAEANEIPGAEIIVHTTPAGMGDSTEAAFDYSLVGPHHVVLDAVYQPLETHLLRVARDGGATCVDGLWMLVHQAVEQQRLWTGVVPDPQAMRDAAEHELARRRR